VGHLNKARSEELEALDSLEGVRKLATEEMERKSLITSELEHSLLQEEISWRQTFRILWLKEGDHCTKFFHQVANSNQRSNSIESLSINGLVSSNQVVIRNHVVQFCKTPKLKCFCTATQSPHLKRAAIYKPTHLQASTAESSRSMHWPRTPKLHILNALPPKSTTILYVASWLMLFTHPATQKLLHHPDNLLRHQPTTQRCSHLLAIASISLLPRQHHSICFILFRFLIYCINLCFIL
jgi:hypothetical protein